MKLHEDWQQARKRKKTCELTAYKLRPKSTSKSTSPAINICKYTTSVGTTVISVV